MHDLINGAATLIVRELVSWFVPHAVAPNPGSRKSTVVLGKKDEEKED